MWEQVQLERDEKIENRIIPTRVGTRDINDTESGMPQDHPHACGDKRFKRGVGRLG